MNQFKSLLFIDDDGDDVFLFREILSEVDPRIAFSSAADGEEALHTLRNTSEPLPHLIFMDLNMPRMDGKECLVTLKTDENLRHIPVVIYTTSSSVKDKNELLQKGAACFISKPASYTELKQILSVLANGFTNLAEAFQSLNRLSV